MKGRIVIWVIWLAVISVGIGGAQTVYDLDGTEYTCRAKDSHGIYTPPGTTKMHKYEISKAKGHEPHNPYDPNHPHDAICIEEDEQITWSWTGAHNITVDNFVPMTNLATCWNAMPFTVGSSGPNSSLLPSGPVNKQAEWCAYDVKFNSDQGPYDPHIIIKGTTAALVEALRVKIKNLQDVINKLEPPGEKKE